jgi:hypothetical protein
VDHHPFGKQRLGYGAINHCDIHSAWASGVFVRQEMRYRGRRGPPWWMDISTSRRNKPSGIILWVMAVGENNSEQVEMRTKRISL